MTKIDDSYYLSNQRDNRAPNPELGKDELLKILMVQLQNQDPLDPMDDKDFVAQMATFSQLEQTMNMASSMDRFVENKIISPVIQYIHMIGKEITYEDVNDDDTKVFVTSEVVSVSQKNGSAIFEIENGEKIGANDITKVSDIKDTGKDDE